MFIYFLVFIVALIYLMISTKAPKSQGLLAVFLTYLAIFIGLGDMIGGYDRYIYGEAFDYIADCRKDGKISNALYLVNGSEYGYFLWQVIVSFFTSNRYIFILLSSVLMYVLYFFAIRQYTKNYPLACIVFLGIFYYFTMTYLRQAIAVGFAWLAVRYIWERKPWHFFGLMLLAFSFHNSAAIFMPMYFLPFKKFSPQSIIWVLLGCLIIGMTPIPSFLMSSAGDATGMERRTASYSGQEMVGFRFEYLLEAVFFSVVFFINYKMIPKTKHALTFLNMSFVFCGILLVFIRFGQGGRFGWYYFIGIIYMLTTLSTINKAIKWMKPFTILLSFILFLRVTLAWSGLLLPYKTFLTNGLPSGERWIYERNEYDANYTLDKFYR